MKNSYFILIILSSVFFGCKKTEPVPPVTAADFIDPLFFGYMQMNYDTNNDFIFQPEEIAAVKELDLTKESYIVNLKGLEKFTELERLNVTSLKLQNKNLKITNHKLKSLYCGKMGLTVLDISLLYDLDYLECYENNLAILDLSNNHNLIQLYCHVNPSLSNLIINNCENLKDIWVYETLLNSLDLSNNKNLLSARCNNSPIQSVNLTNCGEVKSLEMENCLLNSLNITDCKNLETLIFTASGNMKSLDIKNNILLKNLYIGRENKEEEFVIIMNSGQPVPTDITCVNYKIEYI